MTKQRGALLERHGCSMFDWTHADRHPVDRFKVIPLAEGQSEDFDKDSATRKWLWPHLGRDYHLVAFVDIVS